MRRFLIFVTLVMLAVLALSFWNQRRSVAPALEELDRETTRMVQAVLPSVVSIVTTRTVRLPASDPAVRIPQDPLASFFSSRRRGPTVEQPHTFLGSGVIVSREGHVLTNHHVVANMDEVTVQLNDGRKFAARIVGGDDATDLAVLKINAAGLVPLSLGDSDAVKTGQMVFAIGNPFGLQETVTQGIISATGRRVSDESDHEFFQTNTIINPGNSGGPLVNIRGELIGINNAIGDYSGKGTFEGVSFAIPSNAARVALEGILKNGRIRRGYLGIAIEEITPELASQLAFPGQSGALVQGVFADSPAEQAGIRPGDILTELNGAPVKGVRTLLRDLAHVPIDKTIQLKLWRNRQEESVTATLRERP